MDISRDIEYTYEDNSDLFVACSYSCKAINEAYPLGKLEFCSFRKKLDDGVSRKESKAQAKIMNEEIVCPVCGAKERFKDYSEFELLAREDFCEALYRNMLKGH